MPEEEEVEEANGRIRRKAVFSTNAVEQEDDESEEEDDDEDEEDEDGEELIEETPKKKSKKSHQQVKIFFTFPSCVIIESLINFQSTFNQFVLNLRLKPYV